MDYLKVEAAGIHRKHFAPAEPMSPAPYDSDWDYGAKASARQDLVNLRRFLIQPVRDGTAKLGPAGSRFGPEEVLSRRLFKSPIITIGQRDNVVPFSGSDPAQWDPFVFDAAKNPSIAIDIRFRPGMSIFGDPQRPRQMIPLGETRDDTLKASF